MTPLNKPHFPEACPTTLLMSRFEELWADVSRKFSGHEGALFGSVNAQLKKKLTFINSPSFPCIQFTREFNRLWLASHLDETALSEYIEEASFLTCDDIYLHKKHTSTEELRVALDDYPYTDKVSPEILAIAHAFLLHDCDEPLLNAPVNAARRAKMFISKVFCTHLNNNHAHKAILKSRLLSRFTEEFCLSLVLKDSLDSAFSDGSNYFLLLLLSYTSEGGVKKYTEAFDKLCDTRKDMSSWTFSKKQWELRMQYYARHPKLYSPFFFCVSGVMEEFIGAAKNTYLLFILSRVNNLTIENIVALTYGGKEVYEEKLAQFLTANTYIDLRLLTATLVNFVALLQKREFYGVEYFHNIIGSFRKEYRRELAFLTDVYHEVAFNNATLHYAVKLIHPEKPYNKAYRLYHSRVDEVAAYYELAQSLCSKHH